MGYILLAAVLLAVFFFVTRMKLRERNADLNAPLLSEHARIHVKESTMSNRYRPAQYYLYFYIPERDTVEDCLVSKAVYNTFSKGDWGTLTHQGSIFLSFVKDN